MAERELLDPTLISQEVEYLRRGLQRLIVGQDEAIREILKVYQKSLAGMSSPRKPVGSFLFLGPTGSGKTRIVEAMAKNLTGNERALVKINCAEYCHSHEIAKLIGSPPGYLGHRETHPKLSQAVLNQYQTEKVQLSLVLFDEIEKASGSLWNLLLGILDKATLSLGDNSVVDFSQCIIFLTSNLGAREISSILRPNLGFAAGVEQLRLGGRDTEIASKITHTSEEAARRNFTPEFINRLDKIVVFKPLGPEEFKKILEIELRLFQQRIFDSIGSRSFIFSVSEGVRDYLLREGTDERYGARYLQRAIERLVVNPFSNLVATDQLRGGDVAALEYDPKNNRILFFRDAENVSLQEMANITGGEVVIKSPATSRIPNPKGFKKTRP
ncbi:MAG: ATP-dependent Clp protease ATP-binding subunit [Candidatus Yanofskybacteria bacterium]|nr:ATP-dependent Clp protease ATP-binding subunit [Candidatus Yanofskybacteria bacterium]